MNTILSYGSYVLALFCALVVHALVIGLMSINWDKAPVQYADINPYYIEAQVVAENPYTAEKQRSEDARKSKIERKLQQRRNEEAALRRKQQQYETERQNRQTRVVEPEALPTLPLVSREPETVESEPDQDLEAARQLFEAGISQALIEEQNLRKAVTDDEKAMAYVAQIQREIIQNWSRPPSARNGMEAVLRVRLFPTGELMDVKVDSSSGNAAFDRSAMLAVQKAGRFVVPSESRQFERQFREFTLLFRPDDLRL